MQRELGACSAAITTAPEAPIASETRVVTLLPNGRALVVELAEAPADRADVEARLALLIATFDQLFDEPRTSSRPPPSDALHDALSTLADEAAAREIVIIDAHSPMVWSTSAPIADNAGEAFEPRLPEDGWPVSAPAERAVVVTRALPAMETLPRGGHLHHHVVEEGFGMLARSFAGIYVLVLAYEGAFDEVGGPARGDARPRHHRTARGRASLARPAARDRRRCRRPKTPPPLKLLSAGSVAPPSRFAAVAIPPLPGSRPRTYPPPTNGALHR